MSKAMKVAYWLTVAASMLFAHNVWALGNGDTVRIIVPYSAGGGYDAQARLAAPFVESALKDEGYKGVSVIVQNVTGGGGAIATATTYKAAGDGTTILLLDPESSLWQQTLGTAPFDIRNFKYIAQQSADPLAYVVRSDTGISSVRGLRTRAEKKPILMGTSGRGNYDHIMPLIMGKILQEEGKAIPFRYLNLNGTGDILASMRRDEAEATLEVFSTFYKYVKDGGGRYLFTFGSPKALQGMVPSAADVLGMAADKYKLLNSAANFRRVYVAPSKTDAHTMNVLRKAFSAALHDKALVQKSEKANRPILFLDAEDVRSAIEAEANLADQYGGYVKKRLQ